jgi:hypothetical protein
LLLVVGAEYLNIIVEVTSEHVLVSGASVPRGRIDRFVNVVERVRIRRECESAEIATRQDLGQCLSILHIKDREPPGTLAAIFDLVQQEATVT